MQSKKFELHCNRNKKKSRIECSSKKSLVIPSCSE